MATNYAKFGLEANQPIEGDGSIAVRLQNPDFIATSGAHWLRLNFVVPHPSFLDRYDTIVENFISRDMKIYATVGHDATGDFPLSDKLRRADSPDAAAWIHAYVQRFLEIVERYRGKIFIFEAINEPNGWQGGQTALVHPRWFVYLMKTLYQTIRPRERGIRIISGPLEATWVNDNEAALYLNQVFQIGQWTPADIPWDGVGYHIYVGEDPHEAPGTDGSARVDDVRRTYFDFLNKIWGVITRYDPNSWRRLFVSEFGWMSVHGEDFQAERLQQAMDILAQDDRVAMASIFCTEDFEKRYGLYERGMGRAKKAFGVVQALMRTHAPQRTRRVDFSQLEGTVGGDLELPEGSMPWSIGPGLMRHPLSRRGVILLPPFDDGRWAQAALQAGYHGQGGVTLCWSPGEAALTISGEQRLVLVVNPAEWRTPDGSLVPWFQENAPGVLVREETFANPNALVEWLRANRDPFAAMG